MKFGTLGALAAAMLFATASLANATTKDFTYSELGGAVATGSFSYATGNTGVLDYSDLSAFSVTVAGETYDLPEVDTLTDYIHFAYDTATNMFDTDTNSCGFDGCGFASSLSAINSSGTYGFFFNPAPGAYQEYQTGAGGGFDTITISDASAIPEPSTWLLMIVGIGGIGLMLRRAKQSMGFKFKDAFGA